MKQMYKDILQSYNLPKPVPTVPTHVPLCISFHHDFGRNSQNNESHLSKIKGKISGQAGGSRKIGNLSERHWFISESKERSKFHGL